MEWSSPWQEFRTAIRPAFGKSSDPLAGEAHTGLFPVRGMLVSWGLQALLLIAVIVIPAKLSSMRPYQPPAVPKYDVIYYSKDELPRTADLGGAQSGVSGEAGGQAPDETVRNTAEEDGLEEAGVVEKNHQPQIGPWIARRLTDEFEIVSVKNSAQIFQVNEQRKDGDAAKERHG